MKINHIHNENCLDTMGRMQDGFIDLTVTSPPYDNLRDYKDGVGAAWNFETFKPIARELFRVTKDGGVVVWVVADATINGSETGTSFRQALYFMECGFWLHDTMIYQTDKMPLNDNRYQNCFEFMFVFSKSKPGTFNPLKRKTRYGGTKNKFHGKTRNKNGTLKPEHHKKPTSLMFMLNNIWKISSGGGVSTADKIAFNHPAIFPERLAADHIKSWSNEGDLVYDPFGGSGTVAKMSHKLKRNWILSEISKEYTDLANKRIDKYLRQTTLF